MAKKKRKKAGRKKTSRKKVARRKKKATPRKKTQSRKRKTSARKTKANGRGRPSLLGKVSTSVIHEELERREKMLNELLDRREQLENELDALNREIAKASGTKRRGRGRPPKASTLRSMSGIRSAGRRPRNSMNLIDALHKVLTRKTLSVTDVSEAVQKAGYKTSSDNFRVIVNQTLLANPKMFRKVSRGMYTAK